MNILNRYKNMDVNNKIVLKNTIGAFTIKGFALIVSLLTTPAFISYFGDNKVLGVWYTMLSILVWFLNFDLGIGNGIRNNLVKAFIKKDSISAKKIISSGLFSVSIISLILFIIGLILINILDLSKLFNISNTYISEKTLLWSSIFVFLAIMLRFFLSIITSIFYALQKSAVNNFLSLLVSILQLLYVLNFRFDDPEEALLNLSIAYMIISNLPVIIAGIILFSTKLRYCLPNIKYIEKKYIKAITGIGTQFFICQIAYMLIVNTNEFLITSIFGPQYTTEYTFYYKLASLVSMVFTLAMTPLWSVITKALAEENYDWLNKMYKKMKMVGYLAIIGQFMFIPFLQPIMNIWLGSSSIKVNYFIAIAFACFGGVFVYSGILSTMVCGMTRMKLQTIFYTIGVVVKFILIYVLSNFIDGWYIVVWSNVIILLPYCVVQQIDLNLYFKKLGKNTY